MKKLFLVIILFSNCATDQAAKVRNDRKFSLGYLGAAVRPWQNFGLSIDGRAAPANLGISGDDRDITVKGSSINLRTEKFIWDSSAFYVGAGFGRSTGKMTFQAAQTGGVSEKIDVTYAQTVDRFIVPVGWFWIWNNGFTIQIDFGPSWVTKTTSGYANDGGATVDKIDRDTFITNYESKNNGNFLLLPSFFIGYSF